LEFFFSLFSYLFSPSLCLYIFDGLIPLEIQTQVNEWHALIIPAVKLELSRVIQNFQPDEQNLSLSDFRTRHVASVWRPNCSMPPNTRQGRRGTKFIPGRPNMISLSYRHLSFSKPCPEKSSLEDRQPRYPHRGCRRQIPDAPIVATPRSPSLHSPLLSFFFFFFFFFLFFGTNEAPFRSSWQERARTTATSKAAFGSCYGPLLKHSLNSFFWVSEGACKSAFVGCYLSDAEKEWGGRGREGRRRSLGKTVSGV
jgi:hypothetical protein